MAGSRPRIRSRMSPSKRVSARWHARDLAVPFLGHRISRRWRLQPRGSVAQALEYARHHPERQAEVEAERDAHPHGSRQAQLLQSVWRSSVAPGASPTRATRRQWCPARGAETVGSSFALEAAQDGRRAAGMSWWRRCGLHADRVASQVLRAGRELGSPALPVGCHERPGSGGHSPPRASRTIAMRGWAE
jgi:hypothetical protein